MIIARSWPLLEFIQEPHGITAPCEFHGRTPGSWGSGPVEAGSPRVRRMVRHG
jgi:hypothetical protein